jgi:hypothetical protein
MPYFSFENRNVRFNDAWLSSDSRKHYSVNWYLCSELSPTFKCFDYTTNLLMLKHIDRIDTICQSVFLSFTLVACWCVAWADCETINDHFIIRIHSHVVGKRS